MELANQEINSEFHNFSLFGIGKPSEKQKERQRKRALKKDPMFELTGCMKPEKRNMIAATLTGGIQQASAVSKYKKDMAAYKKCLADYKEKVIKTGNATELAKIKSAEQDLANEEASLKSSTPSETVTEDKLLGMPKKVAYVVIGLGVLALAFGGYKAYKHFKG